MSPAHKQRLVGALVLVALFAIIVPTLLDFSGDERNDMKGMEIPPGPDAMKMELLPLDDWSQKVAPAINPPGAENSAVMGEAVESSEPPKPTPDPIGETPAPAQPPQEPKAAAPAETEPAPARIAPVPLPAPKAAPAAAPKSGAGGGSESWVVQVASLTTEAKANELRDRLRKGGYPAFVEHGKSGAGDIYRVKAGPLAQRTAADELKQQIRQSTGLDGLVRLNQ